MLVPLEYIAANGHGRSHLEMKTNLTGSQSLQLPLIWLVLIFPGDICRAPDDGYHVFLLAPRQRFVPRPFL